MKPVWGKAREGLSIGLAGTSSFFNTIHVFNTGPRAEFLWAAS